MKIKTLLAMGLCAAIGLMSFTMASRALADDKDKDEKAEKVKIPDTVEGIWKAIHDEHMELAETIKNKKLDDVHHHAFAIRDLAKGLVPKADSEKKEKVEGTVKNISKLADQLDKSGDAGDQAATEANLKKLDGLLKVLEAQFEKK